MHVGDQQETEHPCGPAEVEPDDADDARDRTNARVERRVEDARAHVLDGVDDRHQSRWYNAATEHGQPPETED